MQEVFEQRCLGKRKDKLICQVLPLRQHKCNKFLPNEPSFPWSAKCPFSHFFSWSNPYIQKRSRINKISLIVTLIVKEHFYNIE
jgi:hypothetical protein